VFFGAEPLLRVVLLSEKRYKLLSELNQRFKIMRRKYYFLARKLKKNLHPESIKKQDVDRCKSATKCICGYYIVF